MMRSLLAELHTGKRKGSLYYFERRIVGLTDGLRGKYEI